MNYGIGNVKAKSGGGDAELNIEYGLTPPSDTSKIWVKCDTPSKVKIEANRELIVSSNENAKKIETEAITTTYMGTYNYSSMSNKMIKMGNSYFFASYGNKVSYLLNSTVYRYALWKYENGNKLNVINNSSDYNTIGVFKYDDTHLLWVAVYSTNQRYRIVDITDNTYTSYEVSDSCYVNACYYGGKVYSIQRSSSSINFRVYTLNGTTESYSVNVSNLYTGDYGGLVYHNGYLYFISTKGGYNGTPTLCRWQIGASTIEEVMSLPPIVVSGTSYGWNFYSAFIYGNKMIIGNISYGDYRTTNSYNKIYIIDLTNLTYETISLSGNYGFSYMCVNDDTGDIELWGGYPTGTIGLQKRIIYNIYELEENTLDLFYDTYFTKNIRLIDSPSLTIDAPIDHAWLGDSNDIAQPVDMFYYENSLWWGVNCLGWTELESVVINISDIVTNRSTEQLQFTLSPVWANQSGICLVRGSGTYSEVYNSIDIPIANVDTDKLIEVCLTKGTDLTSQIVLPVYMYDYRSSVIAEMNGSQTAFLACDFLVDANYQAVLNQMNITSNIGDRVKACFAPSGFYGNEIGLALISAYLNNQTGQSFTFSHPNTWVSIQDDILTYLHILTYSNRDLSPFDLTNATIEYMIEFYTSDTSNTITDSLDINVYDEYGLKATKTITITYSSDLIQA